MGKKPPVYTFQRPRKKSSSSVSREHYTSTNTNDLNIRDLNGNGIRDDLEDTAKYQRWTFYIMIAMIFLMFCSLIYVQMRGIPVKIKG